MGTLVSRKKEKAFAIFELLETNLSEDAFIALFKMKYEKDWQKIIEQFEKEERQTKPGKRHPMPHPDIYMKNLYRNTRQRWDKEHGYKEA